MIIEANNPISRWLTVTIDGVDVTQRCLRTDPKAGRAWLVKFDAAGTMETRTERSAVIDSDGVATVVSEWQSPVIEPIDGATVAIDPEATPYALAYFEHFQTTDQPGRGQPAVAIDPATFSARVAAHEAARHERRLALAEARK